jgi:hypothetical protein
MASLPHPRGLDYCPDCGNVMSTRHGEQFCTSCLVSRSPAAEDDGLYRDEDLDLVDDPPKVRLEDLTPAQLLVACDHAEEALGALAPDVQAVERCRLRGVAPAQEAALNRRLPHATRKYRRRDLDGEPLGWRVFSVWELRVIEHVLTFLGVEGARHIRQQY